MIQDKIGEDITINYLVPFLTDYVVYRHGKYIAKLQDIETKYQVITNAINKVKPRIYWNVHESRYFMINLQTTYVKHKPSHKFPLYKRLSYIIAFDNEKKITTICQNKELNWARLTKRKTIQNVTNYITKIPQKHIL